MAVHMLLLPKIGGVCHQVFVKVVHGFLAGVGARDGCLGCEPCCCCHVLQ